MRPHALARGRLEEDHRRNGLARQRRMSLGMKSRHQKVGHAPTRAGAWKASRVWWRVESCFPTGFPPTCRSTSCTSESEVSSRRRASRKKSPAARRSDDGDKEIRRQRVSERE